MRTLLRPLIVGGLSVAVAVTSLLGSSSVAFAATPTITDWPRTLTVHEGDKPTIQVTFTDPDGAGFYSYEVFWGDGDYSSDTIPANEGNEWTFRVTKSAPYAVPGSLLLQITVNDSSRSTSQFGNVTVLNGPPSINSFGLSASEIEGGQAVTATGAFTDPSATDTHTVTLDWGDGSPSTTISLGAATSFTSDPHTFDALGDFTVTATVTDSAGGTDVATSGISVRAPNQPPTVVSFGVTAGSEGGSSTLALTFADADASDTHTVSVAWGDGSTSDPVILAPGVITYEATHVYAGTGTYTVVLTLEDSAQHTVTATADLVILPSNHAPADLVFGATVTGSNVLLNGSFTDPDADDTHTVTVSWGDGDSATQTLTPGVTTFSAAHVYEASGTYTVTATVTDYPAGASTDYAKQVVVNVPAESPSVILDQMSSLVVSFGLDLDGNPERWLLKKIDDLKDSLAYGNTQVCSRTGALSHLMAFAQRTLESEDYAALSALSTKLEAAAGCTALGIQSPGASMVHRRHNVV